MTILRLNQLLNKNTLATAAMIAATWAAPSTSSSQIGSSHTRVSLTGINVLFDGSKEMVEIRFNTDGADSCFTLLNDDNNPNTQDQERAITAICASQAGDNVYVAERSNVFPALNMAENLYLRSVLIPIIESERLKATGEIELHSVSDLGQDV